jgi:hypothetical protein
MDVQGCAGGRGKEISMPLFLLFTGKTSLRVQRLGGAVLMALLVYMPVLEAQAATKKSPRPPTESGSPERSSPIPDEKALFLKGQLLFDRACPLMVQDMYNTLHKAEAFIAGRQPLTDPESVRRAEETRRDQEQLHREAQSARRDLELFEIDVKARYGGSLPAWWKYELSAEC